MPITWMPYLETGINWIDSQHKELFSRIKKLSDAMTENKGKEEVINTLRFLDSYVILHFGSEEKIMNDYQYPDRELHILEHNKFKDDMAKIKSETESGADLLHVIKTYDKVIDWLINHIGRSDKKFQDGFQLISFRV